MRWNTCSAGGLLRFSYLHLDVLEFYEETVRIRPSGQVATQAADPPVTALGWMLAASLCLTPHSS